MFVAFLASGILAHIYLASMQGVAMWNSEHYSFFPIALLAIGVLLWDRMRDQTNEFSGRLNRKTFVVVLFLMLLLGIGILANSVWLGWVSFLLFLWAVTHIVLNAESQKQVAGTFMIALLIVPLPLSLDTELVIKLQKLATEQGSLLLDWRGIQHATSGVSVQLPGKAFLIDDACSGIHSLFSALTTMLVFAVYLRYGLLRTLLTLAFTFFWVLSVNSLRVFTIVYGFARWSAGLESGWRHDAIGFVSYALIIFLALSTDQIVRFFWPLDDPHAFVKKPQRASRWFTKWSRAWNQPFSRAWNRVCLGCFAVCFAVLGIGSAVQAFYTSQFDNRNFDSTLAYELTEDSLPKEIDGWKRTGFEKVVRYRGNVFGTNSLIWRYENNGIEVSYSLDGAYLSFHDLWYCYSSIGWSLENSNNIQISGVAGKSNNAVATELQLYRGDSEQALVLYTCVDSAGNVVEPPAPADSVARRLLNRLESGGLLTKKKAFVPPVIQFQAFTRSDVKLFAHEREGIQELFGKLREIASRQIDPKNRIVDH